jgi:predicted transglutaminase-like cysteine proteinase
MRQVSGVLLSFAMFMAAGTALSAPRKAPDTRFAPAATSAAEIVSEGRAPIGWADFCISYPTECLQPTLAPENLSLTPTNWTTLQRVNRTVNTAIEQVEDIDLFGVTERWAYPDSGRGDCEDIVLMKRHHLMAQGFPRQALLITVVRDKEGAGHAVLTVKTDRGDFILDNKDARILPWEATGYVFVKRQSQENPNRWVMIGPPAPSGLTVAGR